MKKIITTIGAMLITTLSWAQLTGITLSGGNMISATGGNFDIAVATSGTDRKSVV